MTNKELQASTAEDQKKIDLIYRTLHDVIVNNGWSFRHTFQALSLLLVDGAVLVKIPVADLHQFIELAHEHVKARADKAKVTPIIKPSPGNRGKA